MPAATDHTLDAGLKNVRITVVAKAHPDHETTFHIPPSTIAKSAGVHGADPCLLGSLAHTLSYERVQAPFHLGIVSSSGDSALGKTATHTVATEQETGGYHVVASAGDNVYHTPINVNIAHDGDVHSNVLQMIKRGTRWSGDVGKSANDLVAGLEAHEGISADGTVVSRVLVPVDGSHPCSRALQLNADTKDGPFSQYSTKNRKLVKVSGTDHIIVEREHLNSMAKTLEDNLSASTQIGKHGITLRFKPLAGVSSRKHPPGKVVVNLNIHKHSAHEVLAAGPEFKHTPANQPLTTTNARHMLDGGIADGATAQDATDSIKQAVLGASLAKPNAAAAAMFAPTSTTATAAVPTLPSAPTADIGGAAGGGDDGHE